MKFFALFIVGLSLSTTVLAKGKIRSPASIVSSLSRHVDCMEVDGNYYKFWIDYTVGYGLQPKLSMTAGGTELTPSGHDISVGPVAMNARADCGDRTQYCDEGVSPDADPSEFTLQAATEFTVYIGGEKWTINVNSRTGKSRGTLKIDNNTAIKLNCTITAAK